MASSRWSFCDDDPSAGLTPRVEAKRAGAAHRAGLGLVLFVILVFVVTLRASGRQLSQISPVYSATASAAQPNGGSSLDLRLWSSRSCRAAYASVPLCASTSSLPVTGYGGTVSQGRDRAPGKVASARPCLSLRPTAPRLRVTCLRIHRRQTDQTVNIGETRSRPSR